MKIGLQLALAQHKDVFWHLYESSMRQHIERTWGWDDAWQLTDFDRRWRDCANSVIRYKGADAGHIQIEQQPDADYIVMLIIDEAHRNQGLGQAVIKKLIADSRKAFIRLRVFRVNENALRLYQRLGFELVETEESFHLMQYATGFRSI